MARLHDRLDYVLGTRTAKKLAEVFDLNTVEDLLRYYPRKYADENKVHGEDDDEFEEGAHVTVAGVITGVVTRELTRKPGQKRANIMHKVTLGDHRPPLTATFFNARYTAASLAKGTRVLLSGEVKSFRGEPQLTHPDFLVLDGAGGKLIGSPEMKSIAAASSSEGEIDMSAFARPYFPIYPASAKMQTWTIYACVRQVLDVLDPVTDPLPEDFVREHDLLTEDEALRAIHLAESAEQRALARRRLAFDEAVGLQWALVARRHDDRSKTGPAAAVVDDRLRAALLQRLPFELTTGQQTVLAEVSTDLTSTRPMNRLLQGEVGSGKTVVALLAMAQMIDAGYQCALLAPTEVLAAQHVRSISAILGPLGTGGQLSAAQNATRVSLLTGSMTAAEKRAAREEIASGAAGIVVGTHALLQESVTFQWLGMVVVDEQHRFGVEQRDRLRNKAHEAVTPHLLVMTATPIPRTVALTVYGDLETSTLRELPRGRQPITSRVVYFNENVQLMQRAFDKIREEVAAGRQAYVVAPRIDETEAGGKLPGYPNSHPSATATGLYDKLRRGPLHGLRLGLMHGRLPADEKDAVMAAFRDGTVDVLVCTTVIEVGVDVPNATVMLIADADRFGVSQLHQLRGRIGRGSHPSVCVLTTYARSETDTGKRLQAVADTLDGFALAELDLQARREGDVLGQNQHGRAIKLRFLSLLDDRETIEAARALCVERFDEPTSRLGLLANRFTESGQVEYLDKS